MTHVLFVCLHNAGRSQIARALFARDAPSPHISDSAGSIADPEGELHPRVIEAMGELDIDLSGRRPRRLSPELAEWADVIVTMGCGDSCPYFPGKRYLDWDLPDPAGQPIEAVREIRRQIADRVAELIAELETGS
jgi:protein-tyrosine-phosphatase